MVGGTDYWSTRGWRRKEKDASQRAYSLMQQESGRLEEMVDSLAASQEEAIRFKARVRHLDRGSHCSLPPSSCADMRLCRWPERGKGWRITRWRLIDILIASPPREG